MAMTDERNADQAYASRLVVLLGIAAILCGFGFLCIPPIMYVAKCWFSGNPLPDGLSAFWREGWANMPGTGTFKLVLAAITLWIIALSLVIVGIVKRPRRR